MSDIQSTLDGTVPVKVLIKDPQGTTVRVLVDSLRSAGTYVDTWDGQDNAGRRVPQGVYYAVLEYRAAGAVRTVDLTHTTGGVRSNPPRSRLPSRFAPFAGQPLKIEFSLARASEVTTFIGRFNVDTRLLTFLERVPLGRGTHSLTWNGENADGRLIHPPPDDSFLFGIWAYTLPENAIFVHSGAEVSNLSVLPPVFDPAQVIDAQGTRERSALSFQLSNPAAVELVVFDAATGAAMTRRSYADLPAGGKAIAEWLAAHPDGQRQYEALAAHFTALSQQLDALLGGTAVGGRR